MKLVECPCCHYHQKYRGSGIKLPKCHKCGSYVPIEKDKLEKRKKKSLLENIFNEKKDDEDYSFV